MGYFYWFILNIGYFYWFNTGDNYLIMVKGHRKKKASVQEVFIYNNTILSQVIMSKQYSCAAQVASLYRKLVAETEKIGCSLKKQEND